MSILILLIVFFALCLPGALTFIAYVKFPKFLWCVPITVFLIAGAFFLYEVFKFSPPQYPIQLKFEHYFCNDVSTGFYFLYCPPVVCSILFCLAAEFLLWQKKQMERLDAETKADSEHWDK